MVLNECRQTISRCFSILEKERLSDEGIAAVCDMRKAAGELYEQASNYEDALMLLHRLTKSVADDSHGANVFANPFWDLQEKNRMEHSEAGVFSSQFDTPPTSRVERETERELHVEKDEPVSPRTSIRGSGKISTFSKTEARDSMRDDVKADSFSKDSLEEPMYDALYVEEVEPELVEEGDLQDITEDKVIPKDTIESFENDFKDRFDFDSNLSDSMVESYDQSVAAPEPEVESDVVPPEDSDDEDLGFEALDLDDDVDDERSIFEGSELPDYAVSYADDPYILADSYIENLDDEDMELFIQMAEGESADSDIVRPGSLEKHEPKKEPVPTREEAVENARDKFYMPARSRIAMIRGVEPEDHFNGVDLLSRGYKNEEPTPDYDTGIPTEDELMSAESEFVDEVEEPVAAPSAIMEKVDAPVDEERDDADPSFDDDTLGIAIDKSLLMDEDEYEHQYKVDMITTIAEQDAQKESYRDRMEALSNVSIGPMVEHTESESDDE